MKTCYINSVGCISAQKTFKNTVFLEEPIIQDTNVLPIVKPNYKEYIDRRASRRMAKVVKMGVVAATISLQEAAIAQPDAILTGSGLGCVTDSEKFLENILDNDEQYLTPTAFIQSTHNTVGAQIALGLKCLAYNLTYVHGSVSFESALIDALLLIQEAEETEVKNILVGGVEEVAEYTANLYQLVGHVKNSAVNTLDLFNSNSKGTIFGEGAQFFMLSNQLQESTYAQLTGIEIISRLTAEQLTVRVISFLNAHQLTPADIDAIVLGKNGDIEFDHFYQQLESGIFKNTTTLYYKHISGEYMTASAFGFWVATKILKDQQVPAILSCNNKYSIPNTTTYQRILLYNQYRGENHSLVLLATV